MEISFAVPNTRSEMAALGSVLHTCMAKTPLETAAGARKLLGVLGRGAEGWGHSLGRTQLVPGLRKDTAGARAREGPGLLSATAQGPWQPSCPSPLSQESLCPAQLGGAQDGIWGQPSHPVLTLAPSSPPFTLCPAARWCPPWYLGNGPSSSLFVFLAFLPAGSHPPSPELLGLCR